MAAPELGRVIEYAGICYKNFLREPQFWAFHLARHYAKVAMKLFPIEELPILTPEQTYVLGSIFAGKYFWWRPKRKQALDLFAAGLEHDPSPHMRAMLEIAMAEVYIECESPETARSLVGEVVSLAAAVRHESDKARARVEYMKVLGRAFDLYKALNDDDTVLVQDLVVLFLKKEDDPRLLEELREIAKN